MLTAPAHVRPVLLSRRVGFTLVEVLLVLVILIVLGAIAAPTLFSMNADNNVQAGADTVRARAMEARAAAIGENRTYRLSLAPDGKRIRISPDESALDTQDLTNDPEAEPPLILEDGLPAAVLATLVSAGGQPTLADEAGWVRVATFNPDGTCRDDVSVIEISEPGIAPLQVSIRGLTGAVMVSKRSQAGVP